MRQNIVWFGTITLFVLATASYAQTPKAKPTPKETATSAAHEWPECCWTGKAIAAVLPATAEQAATAQPTAEATSGATTGGNSGAGFTSASDEESADATSAETVDKSNDLKRKLAGAAIKAVASKLKNKNGESSEPSATADSGYIGETEKNVVTDPVNSVQEAPPSKATRRQRIQAWREKMGNATTATTTTTNAATDPSDSVQEIKRPGIAARRGAQQRQVSDTPPHAATTETPVNRLRPLRNAVNTNASAPTTQQASAQTNNPGVGLANRPKIAAIRAARQGNQNTPPQRRTPRERPKP